MKKAAIVIMVLILGILLTACSSEPELVVDNAYKHRGNYNGNYYNNAYTFTIKNHSRTDIESVDYFRIYFYDGKGNNVGVWKASRADLNALALDASDTYTLRIEVPETDLPYDGKWNYDTEYSLNYYK